MIDPKQRYIVVADLDEFEALHERLRDELGFSGLGRINYGVDGKPKPDARRSKNVLAPLAHFDPDDRRLAVRVDHLPPGTSLGKQKRTPKKMIEDDFLPVIEGAETVEVVSRKNGAKRPIQETDEPKKPKPAKAKGGPK